MRRGHRPARTARRCCRRWSAATSSWSRSTTSAGGTATTTSSPTSCRRGCWTSAPELGAGAAPPGEPVVRRQRRARGGDPARDGRWRRRAGGRPGGAEPCASSAATGRRRCCGAGSRRCPRTWSRGRPVLCIALRRIHAGHRRGGRGRGPAAGRRALGRRDGPAGAGGRPAGRDGRRQRGGVRAGCRPGWRSIAPAWPSRCGDGDATIAHARRALELREEDDLLALGRRTALIGLASWADGDLETTHDAVRRLPRHVRAGRPHRRRARDRHHGRGHLRHPGPPVGGDAHLRERPAARRRPRTGRRRAGPPTCTSG